MSAILAANLVVLALLAVLASWEQLRELRSTRKALRRSRRANARLEQRLADTRRALTTVTVERDGFESDRYAARGEAARARHQIAALSQEVNRLRLRLAERPARTVELWPEHVARAVAAREVLTFGRCHVVPIPPGPVPTWRTRDGLFATRWATC